MTNTIYASKSTRGFYTDESPMIPGDAVEISLELKEELLEGERSGKIIAWGDNGVPYLAAPAPATLEELQQSAWALIKAERDRRTIAGITVGGKWVHSDLISRSQWLGLKDKARDVLGAGGWMTDTLKDANGEVIAWKLMDGSFVQVTAQLAFDTVEAFIASDMKLFSVAEQNRAAMLASSAPDKFDCTVSWPKTYAEWAAAQEAA